MPPDSRTRGAAVAFASARSIGGLDAGRTWRRGRARPDRRLLLSALLSLLVIIATGLGLGWLLAQKLVEQDARFVGASTADFLKKMVPELETILETRTIEPAQRAALEVALARSRVVSVALLAADGKPIARGREILPTAPPARAEDETMRALLARALATRTIQAVVLPVREPGWPQHVGETFVPLERTGRLIGVLHVSIDLCDKIRAYRHVLLWAIVVVTALCTLAALVPGWLLWRRLQELAAAEAESRYLAFHDALTELPNRLLFQDRLAQAIARVKREGGSGALLILDLDDFKRVNDVFGHAAGDELLRAVARRLAASVRATDTVARLGGDEFAILLAPLAGAAALETVLARIRTELAAPVRIDGSTVAASATIGVAVFPEDGDEPDRLVRLADAALYRGKALGPGRTVHHGEADPPGRPRAPSGP
ncbi:MAG: GGDEF domain-containing protein [Geminicoccaceae bacterium]|nr:GGDEF domain-containing protein [Geminicoccaceae bacterium]